MWLLKKEKPLLTILSVDVSRRCPALYLTYLSLIWLLSETIAGKIGIFIRLDSI